MLPDEVSEKLLVDAGLVDDLIQETSVLSLGENSQRDKHTAVSQNVQPQFECFEQYRLSLFEGEVVFPSRS